MVRWNEGRIPRRAAAMHGLVAALVSVWALTLTAPAFAESELARAKVSGQVGEQEDGYVGLVRADAPPEVRALVERINEGRRDQYTKIARENSISEEAVAKLAGAKLLGRARPGEWVRGQDGWRQVAPDE